MSRGSGKLQAKIIAILSGKSRTVYGGGPLTTGELADELQAAAAVPADRKAATYRTYRATRAMYWRKLVSAEETVTDNGTRTWAWSFPKPIPQEGVTP